MSSSGIFGKLKMPAISRFRESAPGSGNGEMGIFRVALLGMLSSHNSNDLLLMIATGVALTVGGQVMFWNGGLHMGMGLLLLSHALFIGAYMTITCALAEMTSALPFGGGIYGYVRVTLGPFLGFIVGCCEMLQNVVYGCYCLYPVGHFISELFGLPHSYCSLFWIIMLLFALAINVAGPKYFWSSNVVVLVMAFTMMLLYYAVTFPCMDCEKYAGSGFIRDDANAGATDWFKYFPYAWWIFAGLEMLPMACSDAAEVSRAFFNSYSLHLE